MQFFRGLFLISVAIVFATAADARPRGSVPQTGFNGGGAQINIGAPAGTSYYTGQHWQLNWWSAGDPVQVVSSLNGTLSGKAAWDATGASGQSYFDPSTGELSIPVQTDVTSYGRGLFQSPLANNRVPNGIYGPPNVGSSGAQGQWWLGQVWNLEWTGTISTAGTKITNTGSYGTGGSPGLGTVGDCGTNCITVTMGNSTAATNLALFFVIDASNRSDPPRNIKFYPAQFSTQARSADLATSLLNPDWLAQWGSIGKIRWMDALVTNNSAITDFSQLAEYTFNSWSQVNSFSGGNFGQVYPAGYNATYGPKGGIGPQTICAISNKVGAHVHFPMPYAFTTAAALSLGQAFDGCLNQGLIVEYEYCNEIWNFGGGFACYRYDRRQPYPPIGPSPPFQQAVTITSITTGNPNTTINVASNPYTNGQTIAFSIPSSETIATALDAGGTNAAGPFTVANATGTSFTVTANTTGLSYSSGGTIYLADSGALTYGGYRSAQLMDQIYTAYGASKRSRWKGVLGGQLTASASAAQTAITGALFYLNNESIGTGDCAPRKCLQELYDSIQIAPYAGNSAYNGTPVTAVTQSATPTVTAAGHTFTNGQTIRFYVLTGMTELNNQTATVSGVSGSTFQINIDTSLYTTWATGNGNFAVDNALPKAAEDSIALNISTPGTYPTKYSYFAEQMSDATINGTSVSNPSFGYVVQSSGNYRSVASCSSCIPYIFVANALVANQNGLILDEYEGATFSTYIDTNGTYIKASGNSAADQLYDFLQNWQYDAGTATKGPADIVAAHVAAGQAVGVPFPSTYAEMGGGPGPFNATRYASDTPPAMARMFTQNAAGPYVQPYTPPAWTATYAGNTTNRYFSSGSCSGCTDTLATAVIGTAATRAYILVTLTGGSITSATCDGVTATVPDATTNSSGRTAAIYSVAVGAGSSTRSCSIVTSGASFQNREFYVATVDGLLSGTPVTTHSGTPNGTFSLDYTGGNLLVTTSACSLASGAYANTSGVSSPSTANPTTQVLASDSDSAHTAQFAMMYAPFSSPIFSVAPGCNQAAAAAVYR